MQGVIVLDKPRGISSNIAMSRLKRLVGVSKMGFVGTLDPLATGVLPVFVGKSTKLIGVFENLDKEYRVTMKLGERTDTLDAEGEVLERRNLDGVTESMVRETLSAFQGPLEQDTPAFSAVKINGTPAYRMARRGQPVPTRKRSVVLSGLEIESVELPLVTFRVSCSKGAYMRQLAADAGERLGVGGHVTALRRLRCGSLFNLAISTTLEEIEQAMQNEDSEFMRSPCDFMPDYLPVTVERDLEDRLKHGQSIPLLCRTPPAPSTKVMAIDSGGSLVAIGEAVESGGESLMFRPSKVLI